MDTALSIRMADLDDINIIGFLAQQVWPATYGKILPSDQLAYMMNLLYSPASLRRQMAEEQQYFLIVEEGEEPVGFASWGSLSEEGVYKLHKLYVLPGQQGKGVGAMILQFIFDAIRPEGALTLRLNVNRHNRARQFYEKMGFSVIKEEDVPIGNNYFMNDYVMETSVR